MKNLARVLFAKIVLTVAAWCIPLLAFPSTLFESLGFPVPEPQLFLRLLGVAYLVWVGIVSNGGAFVVLGIAAILGTWSAWGFFAQVSMWISLLGTGGITAGLIAFGPCRRAVGSHSAGRQTGDA